METPDPNVAAVVRRLGGPSSPSPAPCSGRDYFPTLKRKVTDLAVLDHVVLALQRSCRGAQVGERAVDGDQLVVGVDLGADEPRAMSEWTSRGVLGPRAPRDRPGRTSSRPTVKTRRDEQRVAVLEQPA